MMNCAHYRRALLSDPHDGRPEMLQHLQTCHDCAAYASRLLRFEDRLDRSIRVATPVRPSGNSGLAPLSGGTASARLRRSRPGWLAAAASVVLAAVIAGSLWLAAPGPSLAADVVGHMAGEPNAWTRTDVPVPRSDLDQVLAASHVRLQSRNAGLVSYANSCMFRGFRVPHLVVQTEGGPVTVMVLTHEPARAAMSFDEQGYRGIIVPVPGHGSIAVLERGPDTDMHTVRMVADQVLGALDWS